MDILRAKEFAKLILSNIRSYRPPKQTIIAGAFAFLGFGACYVKDISCGPSYTGTEQLNDKVVIITGATSGVGMETAYELADRYAKVYMACRNMKQCEEVRQKILKNHEDLQVVCEKLDLSSFESIRNFVNKFKQQETRLDILVNNAAVYYSPVSKTADGLEYHMGVNYFGHFLLTNLLLDKLKNSDNGRIINVTCFEYINGTINKDDLNFERKPDKRNAYRSSKLANVLFTNELSAKLQDTNIDVFSVDPGICSSKIMRNIGHETIWFKMLVFPFVWPFVKSPKKGAQVILYAALSPDVRATDGIYLANYKVEKQLKLVNDSKLREWLWLVSEKWTRLSS